MDQPRMMAWYGDDGANYSYSNLRLTPSSWTPALRIIKVNVEKHLGIPFNSALLNLYRDGNDSMGAHRDNEKELGEHPFIASVSFGCVRNFFLHHIHDKGLKINLLLENGSLLVMKGATQNFWKHGIKKTKAADNPRINITFRKIIS
jgi:alkylated DNA repair dioxygenase AlkB